MRKTLSGIMFIVFLMLGCSNQSSPSNLFYAGCDEPTTDHITWQGEYWSASTYYGNFLNELKEHSNLAMVVFTGDWDAHVLMIEEAISYNMDILIAIDPRWFFLEQNWQRRIQPNYDLWNAFVELLRPYDDHIIGHYIFDEAYLNGVSFADQEWVIGHFKDAFPNDLMWSTYWKLNRPLPFNLDIVSATPDYGNTSGGLYNSRLSSLEKQMHPHQLLAITLDATYLAGPQILETQKAAIMQEFLDVAKCNTRVIALLAFVAMDIVDSEVLTDELQYIYDEIFN